MSAFSADHPDSLLTLKEVAAELRISAEQARMLTTRGKLPFINVGAGTQHTLRRIRRGDLDAFKRATLRQDADAEFSAARAWAASTSIPGRI